MGWLSTGEFVAVITLRYPEVYSSLKPMEDAEAFNALSRYKFGTVSACLQALNTFTQWTERLHVNLGTGLGTIMRLIDRFVGMERDRKEYASTCRTVFFRLILGTSDLAQLLLDFLVTPDGLCWYRRLPVEWVAGLRFGSKQLVPRDVRPFMFISKSYSV
jgi:hypothetical protein